HHTRPARPPARLRPLLRGARRGDPPAPRVHRRPARGTRGGTPAMGPRARPDRAGDRQGQQQHRSLADRGRAGAEPVHLVTAATRTTPPNRKATPRPPTGGPAT